MRALLATLALAPAAAREHFDSVARHAAMVPMRDGVKLSTFVYRPATGGKAAPGKFPVLIERTRYGKNGRKALVELVAKRGYVVLLQDSRGRFESEGEFYQRGNIAGMSTARKMATGFLCPRFVACAQDTSAGPSRHSPAPAPGA
jgi:predicted alpha/beta hydrolase